MKGDGIIEGAGVWPLASATLGLVSATPFTGDMALDKYCRLASTRSRPQVLDLSCSYLSACTFI